MSILETYLSDTSLQLNDIIKFYPLYRYTTDAGKSASDVTNKYFVMSNSAVPDEKQRIVES